MLKVVVVVVVVIVDLEVVGSSIGSCSAAVSNLFASGAALQNFKMPVDKNMLELAF